MVGCLDENDHHLSCCISSPNGDLLTSCYFSVYGLCGANNGTDAKNHSVSLNSSQHVVSLY